MWNLVRYLAVTGNCFFLCVIFHALYGEKLFSRRTLAYVLICASIIGSMLNFIKGDSGEKVFVFIGIHIVLGLLIFRAPLKHMVLGVLLSYLGAGFGEVVSYTLFTVVGGKTIADVLNNFWLYMSTHVICWLMISLLAFLIISVREWRNAGRKKRQSSVSIIWYLFLCVCISAIGFNAVYKAVSLESVSKVAYGIIFAFLGSSVLYSILSLAFEIKSKENEELKLHMAMIDELVYELRASHHNFRNILHGLGGYIENQEWDDLEVYFDEIMQEMSRTQAAGVAISLAKVTNPALFGLLSEKARIAKSEDVPFFLEINEKIPSIAVSNKDLTVLLGIFLDNAIEAAIEANGSVGVKLDVFPEHVHITIRNSVSSKPDLKLLDKKGYSTKGEGRGIGLYEASRILARYPSITHTTILEEDTFIQEIAIPTKRRG